MLVPSQCLGSESSTAAPSDLWLIRQFERSFPVDGSDFRATRKLAIFVDEQFLLRKLLPGNAVDTLVEHLTKNANRKPGMRPSASLGRDLADLFEKTVGSICNRCSDVQIANTAAEMNDKDTAIVSGELLDSIQVQACCEHRSEPGPQFAGIVHESHNPHLAVSVRPVDSQVFVAHRRPTGKRCIETFFEPWKDAVCEDPFHGDPLDAGVH
jgi:hypothetical protein